MTPEVYSSTTAPNPSSSWCSIPSEHLDTKRFLVKVAEVVLSFVAFVLEEVVSSCVSCAALYLFEFVSCTSFLFTLLLLVLLSTTMHTKVGITCWAQLDFFYTSIIALMIFISSIFFAVKNNGSDMEKAAVAFGFMALVAFLLDLFLFYKTSGLPLKKGRQSDSSNGPTSVEVPPESVKLNAPAAATD